MGVVRVGLVIVETFHSSQDKTITSHELAGACDICMVDLQHTKDEVYFGHMHRIYYLTRSWRGKMWLTTNAS